MFGAAGTKTTAAEAGQTETTRRRQPVTGTSSGAPDGARGRGAKTIEAKEVNLYYGDFHAVEDVSMTIEPNKVTALIGSSGCGKTTFLRSLNRMHELTPGATVKGEITLDGEDIYGAGVDPVQVRRLVGMVFQTAEPVPDDVDLRQRRLRAQPQRRPDEEDRQGRGGRAQPARRPPLGRGQGPARQAGLGPLRRSAAAALHRPRDRGRARRCC